MIVILIESLSEPTLLLQLILNVVASVKGPVLKDPEVFLIPAQSLVPPSAKQKVAFLEIQVTILDPLRLTAAGLAEIVTVGTTKIVAELLAVAPVLPLQVILKVVLVVSGPV